MNRSRLADAWPWLVAAGLVAVFWSVFLGQAERSVFGRVPVLDEVYYLDRAADVVSGRAADHPNYMSPLYPRLIAAVGSGDAIGPNGLPAASALRGLRLLQVGCWLGIVLLLRLTAGAALGPLTASGWRRHLVTWLPAVLFTLYRPAAVFAVSVLLDVPLTFLVTATVALITWLLSGSVRHADHRRVWAAAAGLGFVIGSAALLRGTAVLLVLPAGAIVWRSAGSRRRAPLAVVLLLATLAGVMAPAIRHNTRLSGRPVGPTLNGGVNLYIGNGPTANGFYVAVVPGDWRFDPAGRAFLAERFGRAEVTLDGADRIWARAAWDHARDHPGRTVGLWAKKVWLHLQGWEIDQLTPLALWTRSAPALRALWLPYGVLAACGLVGLVGLLGPVRWMGPGFRGRNPSARAWVAVILVLLAGQSVFFVVSRYRLTLVPLLALLTGWVVAWLLTIPRTRWAGPTAALALAGLLVVPWGLSGLRADWRVLSTSNEAMRWYEIGSRTDDNPALDRAAALYSEALSAGSRAPATWLGLAAVRLERDDRRGAEEALLAGVDALPDHRDLRNSLISMLLQDDRRVEAMIQCLVLLQHHPRDAEALHILSILAEGMLRRDMALEAARRLIEGHPTDPRGYVDLGVLLAREGHRDEARAVFAHGLNVAPDSADLRENLRRLDTDQ